MRNELPVVFDPIDGGHGSLDCGLDRGPQLLVWTNLRPSSLRCALPRFPRVGLPKFLKPPVSRLVGGRKVWLVWFGWFGWLVRRIVG